MTKKEFKTGNNERSIEEIISERYSGKLDYDNATRDALAVAKARFQENYDMVVYYGQRSPRSFAIDQCKERAKEWGKAITDSQSGNWETMKLCLLNENLDPFRTKVYYSEVGNYRDACNHLACSLPRKTGK
jgi:hypothetical protein